jgi:hypothetical protein
MDKIINLRLLARPGNWIKVFLMVLFVVILFDLFMKPSGMGGTANAGTESITA